ncbi:MAG TPA: twin-arginine translocase TatA/TatE family subunit [Alphaproteobacteria bacterium]|jgi:sec-independent protein translocase protein TatA
MGLSIWHVLIVLLAVLILFGAGKLPRVMGDLAKGIRNFKEGMREPEDATPPAKPVESKSDKDPSAHS